MRLIDADDLIKQLEEGVWNSAVEEVKNQPTAYDVEAVVRELEDNAEGFFVRNGEFIKTIPLETAIEIVKRGGRNE